MLENVSPALDLSIRSRAGVSRSGQPLAYTRPPAPDLLPWIGRLYATVVDLPQDYCLSSCVFNDTSCIRIQLGGNWTAQTADGEHKMGRSALLFGPHSKAMPVSVSGSFISVGMTLRPGIGHALLGLDTQTIIDRIVPVQALGLDGEGMLDKLAATQDADVWLELLEEECRRVITLQGAAKPDPVTTAFEMLAYRDPSASIADFAQEAEISTRQLTRIIKRDFGMPPKQILRRARALDMASYLHGVADAQEAEELIMRYFDQAQMTREFSPVYS